MGGWLSMGLDDICRTPLPRQIHVHRHRPTFIIVSPRSSSRIPIDLVEPYPFINSASILLNPSPCSGTGIDHVEPGLSLLVFGS